MSESFLTAVFLSLSGGLQDAYIPIRKTYSSYREYGNTVNGYLTTSFF